MRLVLLPGLDGTGTLFEPLARALAPHVAVTIVRYPGDQPLTYRELLPLARAALPTDEPFVLLGESFSGPIAVALAATRPPQLAGLVLCCTFLRNPRPALALGRWLLPLLPVAITPQWVLSTALFGSFATPDLRALLARATAAVAPRVIRARLREVLAVDVADRLAHVNVPVLYLRATRDRVVPRSSAAAIVRALPRAQVVDLAAPHCLLQAAPGPAAEVLTTFAAQLPRAGR